MEFKIIKKSKSSRARVGKIITEHGEVDTPRLDLGAQILLCNTYHLYLRPGVEVIKEAGGLHTEVWGIIQADYSPHFSVGCYLNSYPF